MTPDKGTGAVPGARSDARKEIRLDGGAGGGRGAGADAGTGASARWTVAGLLVIAVIWGGTFPVVKDLVETVSPYSVVAARFAVAFALLGAVAFLRRRRWRPGLLRAGIVLGLVLWGGYFTQTYGLQFTTASKAGFITALNVVFVAVMAAVLSRRKTPLLTWAGVGVATLGLALLTVDWSERFYLQTGDAWVILCAVLFALHIVLVDRLAPEYDPVLMTWVQVGVVAAVASAAAFVFDGGIGGLAGPRHWWQLMYLAALATAGAVLLQVYLQKFAAPARVGLVLSLEPVFAALFSWALLGETLPLAGWIGGALVLAGVVLAELDPQPKTGAPAAGAAVPGAGEARP